MKELDSPEQLFEQEQTVYQMVRARLEPCEAVEATQRDAMSYRLAEIFVASRVLYTQVLPRFMEASGDSDAALELLGEVRMNLLNMRDLVEEFEESFLESLVDRQGAEDQTDDD